MTEESQKLENPIKFVKESNNPLEVERELRRHTTILAREQGFSGKEEIDAFRHTYTAAIITKAHGERLTRGMGRVVEVGGVIRNVGNYAMGSPSDPVTKVIEDSYKDLSNNEVGIEALRSK